MTTKNVEGKTIANIHDLKEWDDNPRDIGVKELADLREQVGKLGQFKPLLVTADGVVIGGNQRMKVYREFGYTDIWVSVIDIRLEGEKTVVYLNGKLQLKRDGSPLTFKNKDQAMFIYAMADNGNSGTNDKKRVAELAIRVDIQNADVPIAINFGKNTDVMDLLAGGEEIERPEVEFSQELLEEHNYLVLYFDNEIDWLQLQSLYKLPTVKALDSKTGFVKMGVGRVVRGVDFLNSILKK